MLEQPLYAIDDARVMETIRENPWALLVSAPAEPGSDPVISHLPVIQDPHSDRPTILSHLPNSDADAHGLGTRRTAVIVQGTHGYITPTWYRQTQSVPTWDFLVAHLHGVARILDADDTFRVLDLTCRRMESERDPSWMLASVSDHAHKIAAGVKGFALTPDRVVGKAKMSQNKPAEVVDRVVAALRTDPYHGNPSLAEEIERAGGPGGARPGIPS